MSATGVSPASIGATTESSRPHAADAAKHLQAKTTSHTASKIASLLEQIRHHTEVSKEAQQQLARIVVLLIDVRTIDCEMLAAALEIAVSRLLLPNPDIEMATTLVDSVEERLRILSHPWVGLRRGSSPAAKVVFGMTTFLVLLLTIAELTRRIFHVTGQPLDFHTIPIICCVGALGSFVSIMTRINEFAALTRTDASVLFLTGFFKPWVGASFAFFLYVVLLSSGMSVITENDYQGFCFVLTAAFLAGFSERFAKDVAARAENAFTQITFPPTTSNQSQS